MRYDTLIVATGAHHAYFGHDEWAPYAQGLKTIDDAIEIRRRILIAFEAAERESDPALRRAWMTFVLVGGGPTGVELAGALGEIANDTLRNDFRSIRPQDARIVLVEAMDRVLPTYPPGRSASARRQLERLGVVVRTATQVVHIEEGLVRVKTPDGAEEEIQTRTVLWAAGVLAASFGRKVAAATGAETDRNGRIRVRTDLTIPGHPEIFAVGDAAIQPWKKDRATPGVAQGGIQGGTYAAKSILARLNGKPVKPYRYSNRGDVAVIGRLRGVTDIPWMAPVRPAGRVHRVAALAPHPHHVPHRVLEPDRRGDALGVLVPDPRPVDAADHGTAAGAADRGAAGDRSGSAGTGTGAGARAGPALGGGAAPRPALGDEPSQPFDARLDRALRDHAAYHEDQATRAGRDPPRGQAAEGDAGRRRCLDDCGLVHVVRQPREHVEPGRRAHGPHVRQVAGQGPQQRVAATAVDRSHPAQVVVAPLQDVGEGQLVERRRAHVGRLFRRDQGVGHRGRGDQPAKAQPGGEDLARGAGVPAPLIWLRPWMAPMGSRS